MKIRFLKKTSIRLSAEDMSLRPIGSVRRGVELETDGGPIAGAMVNGVSVWYKDANGWYYWGGATEPVEQGAPAEEEEALETELPDEPGVEYGEEEEEGKEAEAMKYKEEMEEARPEMPPEPQAKQRKDTGEKAPGRGSIEYQPELMNWGLNALNIIDGLWNKEGLTGENVNIAILSTGINRLHPALKDTVYTCRNFCAGDKGDVSDEDGLGTRCAGIIAGRGEGGLYGLAPKSALFVGKTMPTLFDINFSRLLDGLRWAIQQPIDILFTPVDLRESSLLPEEKEILAKLVEEISDRGIIFIAPVGNAAISRPEDRFPAALPYCLSVGACGQGLQRYKTSLRSQSLDILAPGEDLLTTSAEGGATAFFSGTSAAAAFASGAVALIAEYAHRHSSPLTIPLVLKLIRETACPPKEGHSWDTESGYGVIDPCRLLDAVKAIGPAALAEEG